MKEIQKFENFAEDAEQVRRAVIAGPFTNEIGPDGALYTGISTYPMGAWVKRIEQKIGKPIIPRLSCFRLNLAGELPHSWVHSDGICASYASVLYLNPAEQCAGGTAFWKHIPLGINKLPSRQMLEAIGIEADFFMRQMSYDWKKLDLWEKIDFVEMRWNRFITYPTSLFHSRYPFEGFGKNAEDGRLIWICFYDRADEVAS